MIVLDENIDYYFKDLLLQHGFNVMMIAEVFRGCSDVEVIKIVEKEQGILVTEDKDFGELVFAHGFKNVSVIFLRYDQPNYHQVDNALLKCIKIHFAENGRKYFTISKSKVRIRDL